jgi:hypothetical protein
MRYFPHLHFQCYSKSPPYPPTPLPYPPTPPFWPWRSPVLGHIKFASPLGLSSSDDRLGHLLIHMQLRDKSSRVLVGSYCCFTYRVAFPFSSLGTFSSSSLNQCIPYLILFSQFTIFLRRIVTPLMPKIGNRVASDG